MRRAAFLSLLVLAIAAGDEPKVRGKNAAEWGRRLHEGNVEERLAAVQALKELGPQAYGVVAALGDAMEDSDAGVSGAACRVLEAADLDPADRATFATRAAKGNSAGLRVWGLRQAASLGAKMKGAEPLFLAGAADADARVRIAAIDGLGHVANDGDAVACLVKALGDPERAVRLTAISALAAVGENALPALVTLMQGKDDDLAYLAAVALGRMGGTAKGTLPQLAEMLRDEDEATRERAAGALRRLGDVGKPVLEEALKSDAPDLVALAKRALAAAKHGGPYPERTDEDLKAALRGDAGADGSAGTLARSLAWLARHQAKDGSWRAAGFADQCNGPKCEGTGDGDFDVALTGLALLAFLGDGHTTFADDEYGRTVGNGVRWLIAQQDADGRVGPKVVKLMYNQAIATQALAEAYGMTQTGSVRDAAQRAIDFLVAAKNPSKAWRYTPRSGENDTSVTGWCVAALEAAERANLNVGHSTLVEAKAWVDENTDKNSGVCGYESLENGCGRRLEEWDTEKFNFHQALAAEGMTVRIAVDHDRKDPLLELASKLLGGDLPVWDEKGRNCDFDYWYWGTCALYRFDGPESGRDQKYWKTWNQAAWNAIVKNQLRKDAGCADGSWDPVDRWGYAGGRVYATAINALTLETPNRYPSGRRRAPPK